MDKFYNIWRYNPGNDDIEVIMPDIEGIDQARDLAAARSMKTQVEHTFALVGGEYDQLLRDKLDKILADQEEQERFAEEQIKQATELIADRPCLFIHEHEATNEETGAPYYWYELMDSRPGHKHDGFYNADIDDLVYAVEEYLKQHPIES